MEFDVNLILVPITLVFLVAYLADKFWLKQHKIVKENAKQVSLAQKHFNDCQKVYKSSLNAQKLGDIETFTPTQDTPSDIRALYDNYHATKRRLSEVKSRFDDTKKFFLVEWAYEYLPILLFLVIVRAFVAEPFNIPSSSMVPSLYTGDFIVVNKSAYGLRLPITHTKILDTGSPQHGDVVVFRYPENPKRYYIKRMIGLPGDTVAYHNGVLFINGQAVSTTKVNYQMTDKLNANLFPELIGDQRLTGEERTEYGKQEESHAHYYQETLGEHRYVVRYLGDLNSASVAPFLLKNSPIAMTSHGTKWEITVPEGQYFVMGDNRDRSEDGRFWGFVPESHLSGKATHIWMHKEAGLSVPTFSRAGRID